MAKGVGRAEVILGEEGDHKLLGVFTLGALEFVLDPLKRELKPLPVILYHLATLIWEYQTLIVRYNEQETYLVEVTHVNNEHVGKLIEKGKGVLGVDKYAYLDLQAYLIASGQEGWEVVNTLLYQAFLAPAARRL